VTRLLVLHASSSMSRWSSAGFIASVHKTIQPTPNPDTSGLNWRGDYTCPVLLLSVNPGCSGSVRITQKITLKRWLISAQGLL
jgi:hypothetical protein